jgi:hypothetical protein
MHCRDEKFIKVKVKLSLCFNWAPRHEGELGEWRYSSTHSLTSALDGGEWLVSCSGRFTPKERVPGIHWIRGWLGPRAVLDAVVKRKIPSPLRESNPRTPIVQLVAQCYTDWAFTSFSSFWYIAVCPRGSSPPEGILQFTSDLHYLGNDWIMILEL